MHTRQQRHCLGTDLPGHQGPCSSLLLSSTVHRQQPYATQTHRSSHQILQLLALEHFLDHLSTGKGGPGGGGGGGEKHSNTYLPILTPFSLLKVLGKRWFKERPYRAGDTAGSYSRVLRQHSHMLHPQHCLTQICRACLSTMPVLQKVEMGTQKFKASLSSVESCLKKGGHRERSLLQYCVALWIGKESPTIPCGFVDRSCLEWATPQTGK
jgi:hypothetical protein